MSCPIYSGIRKALELIPAGSPHKAGMTLFIILSLFATPAHTQQTQEEEAKMAPLDYDVAYRYQPEYCDFTAAFPEEPLINHACEKEDDPSSCFEQITYTKVFDMATTVGVKIICNPADEKMFKYFTPEVMEDTVRKMTEASVLETFHLNSTEKDEYRLAGLVGQGKRGLDKTLFIAQLWISEKSIMSVEAEISGTKLPEADKLFAGLLNHIGYAKEVNPQTPEE